MRIIAGKHRGTLLASFEGESVRPTSDRVKESVFQILSGYLAGARVLDLFCGSGALGIECLSRGAREVCFNDCSKDSLAILKKNLLKTRESGAVSNSDFRVCLSQAGKFDLIFSDPPYKEDFLGEICSTIKKHHSLAPGGVLVHESEREEKIPEGFVLSDARRYGRTSVYFLKEQEENG